MRLVVSVLLCFACCMVAGVAYAQKTDKLTREERVQAFRQKILESPGSLEKLHAKGIELSYLASLKWKVYPSECKEIILISSSHQRLIKFVDGLPKYIFTCSTRAKNCGKEGFGFYTIQSRETLHRSRKYPPAVMYYAMMIDHHVFIHGSVMTRQLGTRASKGCIRLLIRNSRILMKDTKVGTPVAYLK